MVVKTAEEVLMEVKAIVNNKITTTCNEAIYYEMKEVMEKIKSINY